MCLFAVNSLQRRAPFRGGGKIHGFRMMGSQASEASDHGLCEKLWAQLPSLGLEPQDSESGSPGMMVSLRSEK